MILEYQPSSLGPSAIQYSILSSSTEKYLKRPNSAHLKSREFAACPPHGPEDLKLHHLVVTAAKAALVTAFPTSSSLLVSTRSSMTPLLVGSSISYVRKLSLNSKNIPRTSRIVIALPCCPSNRYLGGWNAPKGPVLLTLILFKNLSFRPFTHSVA